MIRKIPDEKEQQEVLQRPAAPYPAAEESEIVLPEGAVLKLRPIRLDDGPNLLGLYGRLSPESLHFRFFVVPQADPSKAEYLAHVDYVNQFAFVAEKDGQILGVARYHRNLERPDHAEMAFTVADAWQGKGLGTILFQRLADVARRHGIAFLEAEVLPDNERMLRVFRRTGFPLKEERAGQVIHIEVRLDAVPAS